MIQNSEQNGRIRYFTLDDDISSSEQEEVDDDAKEWSETTHWPDM